MRPGVSEVLAAEEAPQMAPLTLFGVSPTELLGDVYFRPEYVRLHGRPDGVDILDQGDMLHAAVVRDIPDTEQQDLETAHGYGGPVATEATALARGIAEWRRRQAGAGRVAEFVRLHPFLNPLAYREAFDEISFNRTTVLVDLGPTDVERRRFYSKGTRHAIKRGQNALTIRTLGPRDAQTFKDCYEVGLKRNKAVASAYFQDAYYRDLLAADWCTAWAAEAHGDVVAVACFIAGDTLAHYHFAGGLPESRASGANYALLEHAFAHFQEKGCRWMHLGGGRTADDGDALLRFKAKFSPLRAAYYVGGMIFDHDAYRQLAGARNRHFLSYRFPQQRQGDETNTERLTLHPATVDDFAQFFRLRCDVENIFWSGFDSPPAWIDLAEWYNRQLAPDSGKTIYVAEVAGRIVGYAYANWRDDTVETALAVDQAETGKGWGREILRQLCSILSGAAVSSPIEAWIFPQNVASTKAHEAAGYRFNKERGTRTVPMAIAMGGDQQACWVWRKEA